LAAKSPKVAWPCAVCSSATMWNVSVRAAELSLKVNFEMVEEPIRKAVVYLDPL
jgi:hypothetical protein